MLNRNLTITLDHILEALRDCQTISPKPVVDDPKTQIDLPERILSRAREEASVVGVSPEVLVIALLQVFHEADEAVKVGLAKNLANLRNPGGA